MSYNKNNSFINKLIKLINLNYQAAEVTIITFIKLDNVDFSEVKDN